MSAGDLRVYSGAGCTFAFGPILPQGLGPQEFCTIEEASDAYTDEVGVDGEVTRSETLDYRATITLTLMQTSATNDLLSAVHNADKRARGGVGIMPFFFRDRNGRAVFKAEKCWIQKGPNRTYGRAAGTRVWTFRCADLDAFDGGN